MADKPAGKPGGKPAPKPSGGSGGLEGQMVFAAVILVVIIFVIVPTVLMFFGYSGSVDVVSQNWGERLSSGFSKFVDTVGFIAIFISLLLVMGLIYAKVRFKEISKDYENLLKAKDDIGKGTGVFKPAQMFGTAVVGGVALPGTDASLAGEANGGFGAHGSAAAQHAPLQITNEKWIEIQKHMQSNNASEWKIAILEADIMLYDMLSQMGYEGDSIGEILKKVDKVNFVTLDDAWKAHRIRNIIAHEGSSYELSREEADRTIRLFKRVFDEFYFV